MLKSAQVLLLRERCLAKVSACGLLQEIRSKGTLTLNRGENKAFKLRFFQISYV